MGKERINCYLWFSLLGKKKKMSLVFNVYAFLLIVCVCVFVLNSVFYREELKTGFFFFFRRKKIFFFFHETFRNFCISLFTHKFSSYVKINCLMKIIISTSVVFSIYSSFNTYWNWTFFFYELRLFQFILYFHGYSFLFLQNNDRLTVFITTDATMTASRKGLIFYNLKF